MAGLDDAVPGFGVTARQIVAAVAAGRGRAEAAAPGPRPLQPPRHAGQLDRPRSTPCRPWKAAAAHFTHIQFHSYGGGPDDQGTFCSKVPQLAEYVNAHPNLTVDVGQVLFGDTTSMTGDGPLGHFLHKVTGRKWFNGDTECEAGCGIVPIEYKEKSFVHALQWAIGLEWYLLVNDPWRVAMSTDHPNGGSFLAYPEIVALLMSRDYRREVLKRLPARGEGALHAAGPGPGVHAVRDRHHHPGRPGPDPRADAQGAPRRRGRRRRDGVHARAPTVKAMFELPRYVFKAGELVVEQGEIRLAPFGPTLVTRAGVRRGRAAATSATWFEAAYTLRFANYPVGEEYLPHGETVDRRCRVGNDVRKRSTAERFCEASPTVRQCGRP